MGRDGTWQWDVIGPSSERGGAASRVHDVIEGGCMNAPGLKRRQWLWVGGRQ